MSKSAILKVDIVTDAKGVGPGVDQAEGKLGKLGGTALKVGKMAALGLAAGLGLAAVAAFKLAKGAAEDEAAAARLANSLKNTTGATRDQVDATEDWITAQGKSLGVADDDLRPALDRLAKSTGSISEAQKLTSLAMDGAAGSGKSLEAVTNALAKANEGSMGGLAKLGVATKNAAGETLTFEQVTQNMSKTFDGAAETAANTTAGKWGRVKLGLAEVGEGIGAKLLPMGAKAADWALKFAPRLESMATTAGKKLAPAFDAVSAFISDKLVPAGKRLYEWFIDKILPKLKDNFLSVLDSLKTAFANVTTKLEENRPQLEKLGRVLAVVGEKVTGVVIPALAWFYGKVFKSIGTAIGLLVDAVGLLVDAFEKLWTWGNKVADTLGKIKMPSLPDVVPDWLTPGDSPMTFANPAATTAGPAAGAVPVTVNVYVPAGFVGDEPTLARVIQTVLANQLARLGTPSPSPAF